MSKTRDEHDPDLEQKITSSNVARNDSAPDRKRDELAEAYVRLDGVSHDVGTAVHDAYKAGWDAHAEQVQGLVEALDALMADWDANYDPAQEAWQEAHILCRKALHEKAREALAKYRGENEQKWIL